MTLIVVESPTKARTFNRILKMKGLDSEFEVFATVGHFRDLPVSEIAINYEKDFQPQYAIIEKKEKVVAKLRDLAQEHKKIILATDADREGESISYHVAYLLGFIRENWPDFSLEETENVKRIVFHEITPKALEEALAHPTELRIDLVKAQQARRILDRVVGYELSPLLWKKTGKNWLSAGRVQTVALRLIVEREKEINAFAITPYYQIFGNFKNGEEFRAKLVSKKGEKYEVKTKMKLFVGEYEFVKTTITEENLPQIKTDLENDTYTVADVTEEIAQRFPPPPYTTSLMQQDAFQKHGFPSKLTMRLAQSLYERGLITYHRTDSFNLSAGYVFGAKDYITKTYGQEYALEKPRGFRNKSKNAQEAHEAIRPTKVERTPKEVKGEKKLSAEQMKLYELIFNRALATQMKEAEVKNIKVTIKSSNDYEFEADSQQVLFDGFMKILWPDYSDKHRNSVQIKKGSSINLETLDIEEKKTKPPYRFNEATLIKALEEKEIGRPSTYASIISLIQDKHYIDRESRYFMPTALGTSICDYLSNAFPDIFNLEFTANMEGKLDDIANGDEKLLKTLQDFYNPFVKELEERKGDTTKLDINETLDEDCPQCGNKLMNRYGKFGKFISCSNYPACKYIKPNLKFVPNQFCPDCKGRITVRYSQKTRKRFYGCENYPTCKFVKFALADEGGQLPTRTPEEIKAKEEAAAKKKAPAKKKSVKKKKTVKKTTKTATKKTVKK